MLVVRAWERSFSNDVKLEMMPFKKIYFHVFYSFKLCRRQAKQSLEGTTQKFETLATTHRFEIMSFLDIITLCRRQDTTEGSRVPPSKYNILETSRSSRSAPNRVHVEVRHGQDRARSVRAAPRRRRSNEAIWPRNSIFFREPHTEAEKSQNS